MSFFTSRVHRPLAAMLLVAATANAALAHHGWAWAEEALTELAGTIEGQVYVGNPHATLQLRNEQGLWQVELAPPAGTIRAGFVDGVAVAGDAVMIWGHRSRDPNELRLKGIRVLHEGRFYDVYPDMVREENLPATPPQA